MAGKLNRLTVRQVQTITAPGRYADGGGLYLKVRPSGSRQWVFLFARIEGGKRVQTEIGLGSAAPGGTTLALAREKADEHRRSRAVGNDPLERKKAEKVAARVAGVTFGKFADEYVNSHKAAWSNAKHAQTHRVGQAEGQGSPEGDCPAPCPARRRKLPRPGRILRIQIEL